MNTLRYLGRCLIVAALLAARGSVGAAEVKAGSGPKSLATVGLPGLDTRISLDLKDAMDIGDFIKYLATKANLNVVIGSGVTGTIKLMLQDVTVGEALDIVLAANNLAYEVKGNIIKILSADEYSRLNGQSFYDRKATKIIELKYAVPSRLAAMLGEMKSTVGTIVFDDASGTLVLIDTPDRIQAMEALVAREEIPPEQRVRRTVTKVFALQHATVEELQPEVAAQLTKDVGQLRVDKRTKTLIVTDLPAAMEKVAKLIATFDRKSRQVFIEAKIVQVSLQDASDFGINWDHLFQGINPRFSLQMASTVGAPIGGSGANLVYRTLLGGSDLSVVMHALQTIGDTKILSSPHIATVDGQEATIKVIRNQPYVEQQFESGTTNVIGQTYKFVEVGVSLNVTPRINEDRMIAMEIKPEISDIPEWYRGDPQQGTPVVEKSVAETSVLVKDGETIIIAGLIRNERIDSTDSVPFLGRIPLIGNLFKYTSHNNANNELVVFLTPRLITGEEPFPLSRDLEKTPKEKRPVAETSM